MTPAYTDSNMTYIGKHQGMVANWRFSHSMFVPVNTGIIVEIKRRAATNNSITVEPWASDYGVGDVPITVSVRGRYVTDLKDVPNHTVVPYATAWSGTFNKTMTVSDEFDLKNTLDKQVHFNKLFGLVEGVTNTDLAGVETYQSVVRLTRSGSYGGPTDGELPFSVVFPIDRGCNDTDMVFEPNERLMATYRAVKTQSGSATNPYVAPLIGLVGWRKEVL